MSSVGQSRSVGISIPSGPDARPSPGPPRGHTTPKLGQSNTKGAADMYRGGGAARSLARVVPRRGRSAPGAAPCKPGVSSNGSKELSAPPPEPPPLLTAGERGPLAPRTARSCLSRTLRRAARRAARAALRSSRSNPPRTKTIVTIDRIVLRRRVNVRLFPGRAAQGHHNPPQSHK